MELSAVPQAQLPIIVYCNNNGAVVQSKNPRHHQGKTHIEWKYHLIRELVQRGDVIVIKVHQQTTYQIHVDMMGDKFEHLFCEDYNTVNLYIIEWFISTVRVGNSRVKY